ncbi:VC0807 family protein [Saccharopolyspora rosea]|uniref:VC0807 family protein n=1 Tax=Saccharopolyspora rosea TaxID=524884 RepID=A0ABW3FUA2_9PSEU|nr:VC0807 family protein [Saccharopolyspora rosea]
MARDVPDRAEQRTVHLHGLTAHLWHAAKHLAETVLAPLLLFFLLLEFAGFVGGLLAALAWVAGALAVRLVRRTPVPTVLWLSAAILAVRTAAGFATGSTFVYLVEPSLQNFLLAAVLLASLPFERTFLAKLADDFCILPPELTGNARVKRFFRRVSLLWALVFTVNGLGTLWALAAARLRDFLVLSTAGSFGLVALAAVASLLWFRRELRGAGIRLRFGSGPSRSAATGG